MLSTIAVHLDYTERCEVRTQLAARLASLHRSHLVGIVPTGCDPAGPILRTAEAADVVIESSLYRRRRAEGVAHVFRWRLRGTSPLTCEARLVDGEPVQAVVRFGRASDLVIVGQAEADAAVDDAARRLPEDVMVDVGRPVLIVPRTGGVAHASAKVLLAWDGSREASIALRGAMPLLQKAERVTLLSFERHRDEDADYAPDPSLMRGWLLRHGVQADVEYLTASMRFADALLDRTEVLGADLLVMGGYGHARLGERMLGGVTREVLARADLPVLMAH